MTYLELLNKATDLLDKNKITIGEWEKMIEPLHRQVLPDFMTELVRCGECIHHDVYGRTTKYFGCKFYDIAVDADHFCKKGERRTDD